MQGLPVKGINDLRKPCLTDTTSRAIKVLELGNLAMVIHHGDTHFCLVLYTRTSTPGGH